MPGNIKLSLGGANSVPFFTTKILLAAPSVSHSFSRNKMVSAQPAATAIWRSKTLGNSEMALMSQRSQRLSVAVRHATPSRSKFSAGGLSGLLVMNTVGATGGLGKA